jgi:hypothetical protein
VPARSLVTKGNPSGGQRPRLTASLNQLKHGSTSKSLFLKDEKPEEFFALLESAFEQYQPFCETDAGLVSRYVHDY